MVTVKVKRLTDTARAPVFEQGSTCFKIFTDNELKISDYRRHTIYTGMALKIPKGYYAEILPLGRWSDRGLRFTLNPRILRSGDNGEVLITCEAERPVSIEKGAQVAQGIIHRVTPTKFKVAK